MTPNEFKAWFDGFTEAFESRIPTKAQWGRIKDRVAEIDGKPVTERVYVDRYLPSYPYWYQRYGTIGVGNSVTSFTTGSNSMATSNASAQYARASGAAFNSSQAMAEFGRAEARAMS